MLPPRFLRRVTRSLLTATVREGKMQMETSVIHSLLNRFVSCGRRLLRPKAPH